jgi:hypothetical protein
MLIDSLVLVSSAGVVGVVDVVQFKIIPLTKKQTHELR